MQPPIQLPTGSGSKNKENDSDSIRSVHDVSSCDSAVPDQQTTLPVTIPQNDVIPLEDDPLFPSIRKRTSVSGEDQAMPSTSNCPESPSKKSKCDRKRQREETPKSSRPADAVSGSSKFQSFFFTN